MDGYYVSFRVTHLINFILSLRRLLKISGRVISPFVPILAICATGIGIFAASFVGSPVFRGGAFLTVLSCLLFLLRIVSKEDISWLRGLIARK